MLRETLENRFGAQLADAAPVSGGDINAAYRLTLTDGTRVFMKANRAASPAFFQAEADGLAAIRNTGAIGVPEVIAAGSDEGYGSFLLLEWIEAAPQKRDFWEAFGHSLARMHLAHADRFGWVRNNYIGSSPQVNAPRESWIAFFRDCRLAPQFQRTQHRFDTDMRRRVTCLLDHLGDWLVEPPRPSLLHGDLWSGNFITGTDGQALLIDPAAYVGHAEADLAMTELFGGFHPRFYAAYQEVNPLQSGYNERRDLYNLYHLLNHLNLFGSGYLSPVERIIRRYAGR